MKNDQSRAASVPLFPCDPGEVDSLIGQVQEWGAWPREKERPAGFTWEESALHSITRMIYLNFRDIGIDPGDFASPSDCLHPPMELSRWYTGDLLMAMLLKCLLARDLNGIEDWSIRELRAQLMEFGFAAVSGFSIVAEREMKQAIVKAQEQVKKRDDGYKSREDSKCKDVFQKWLKDKNISVSWMNEFEDMKRGDIPDEIAAILGKYAEKTKRAWYKEVRSGTLKSGRRPGK